MKPNSTLNWDEIDTILLDMDGTLLDLNYDYHFWLEFLPQQYAQTHNCTPDSARTKIIDMVQALQGTLNWYCLDFWSDQLDMDIVPLKAEVAHLIQERPYTLEFLNWLKTMGKTNILVTNSHQAGVDLKFKHSNIAQYMDHTYTSHQFKEPKESQRFWQKFYEHHPFDLQRTLFIDDNETVLQAAQTFGVKYLLTIAQPDMSKPARKALQFEAISCYQSLIANAASP